MPLERSAASPITSLIARNPLAQTLQRARTVASPENIAAVVAGPSEHWRQSAAQDLSAQNVFVQPRHQGTAYEVLLALLHLDARVAPETAVVFLPSDHVVSEEDVMTRSLVNMVEWISRDPSPVYLLGAVPEGPHDQLGYIVPWYDSMQVAAGVYEFVEEPDLRQARKLINAGGLWNTFIFAGTVSSLIALFRPKFDATIRALRAALPASMDAAEPEALRVIYDCLIPADFSHDLLTVQADRLNVLRMPRCGWWPLKSPKHRSGSIDGTAAALGGGRDTSETNTTYPASG